MTTATSLAELLAWFRSQRFTGSLTLHIHGGVPREATWGTPNRVVFPRPQRAPSKDPLDTSPPHPVGSSQEGEEKQS